MADHSFSNWIPPLSLPLLPGSEDEQDVASSELFMHNRQLASTVSHLHHHHHLHQQQQQHQQQPRLVPPFFQSEMNNVSQLAKLYQNIPIYGNGPLTDDEKSEIARRNENFGLLPEVPLSRVDEDELAQQQQQHENENA